MDDAERLKRVIRDLEIKLQNSYTLSDITWNKAIFEAMNQFGVEHKPRCVRTYCPSCNARELLSSLIREENLNRKSPRELIGEFIDGAMGNKNFIGKEKKAYLKGIRNLFEFLIDKGIV